MMCGIESLDGWRKQDSDTILAEQKRLIYVINFGLCRCGSTQSSELTTIEVKLICYFALINRKIQPSYVL